MDLALTPRGLRRSLPRADAGVWGRRSVWVSPEQGGLVPVQDLGHNGQSLGGNSDLRRMAATVKATMWPSTWPAEDSGRQHRVQGAAEPDPTSRRTGPQHPPTLPWPASPSGAPLSPASAPHSLPTKLSSGECWAAQRGSSTLISHCFYRKVSFCQKGKIKMGTAFPCAPLGIVILFIKPSALVWPPLSPG